MLIWHCLQFITVFGRFLWKFLRTNDSLEQRITLPLDDDFDISLSESNFEQNVEVLVPNDEDDPDNLLDDETEPDQDLPPDNQLDFGEILSAFEPNETVNFPENFNVSLFLKIVMENCQVDPKWDTTDKLCMKETSVYENLKNEPRFLQFLKVQWDQLVSSLKKNQWEN